MTIRKTRREDFPAILKIYEDCRTVMHGSGLRQWLGGYPGEEALEKDFARGESYVLCDGERVAGCAAVIFTGETTYNRIEGCWLTDGP